MDNKSKKRKLKNDIILAVVIVLLATAGLLLLNTLKEDGDMVVVKVDGVETERFSLSENVKKTIYTDGKNNENILVIEDGVAFVEKANCRDKICVEHKPVSKKGESIICLPHKVVIEIISDSNENDIDVVV